MNKYAYRDLFAGHIDVSLKTAVDVLARYPASASAFARIGKNLKKAERLRAERLDSGLEVPPLLIVSTTERCNLACAGCYSCASSSVRGDELEDDRIAELLDEASELGTSIVMLAGGEPLLSHGWLDAIGGHDELVGIVFTNGTLLTEARRAWFAGHRHVIPVFSIEGGESQTDARRGDGVFAAVTQAMRHLCADGVPFSIRTSERLFAAG